MCCSKISVNRSSVTVKSGTQIHPMKYPAAIPCQYALTTMVAVVLANFPPGNCLYKESKKFFNLNYLWPLFYLKYSVYIVGEPPLHRSVPFSHTRSDARVKLACNHIDIFNDREAVFVVFLPRFRFSTFRS